jgi:hypothetical protein
MLEARSAADFITDPAVQELVKVLGTPMTPHLASVQKIRDLF